MKDNTTHSYKEQFTTKPITEIKATNNYKNHPHKTNDNHKTWTTFTYRVFHDL
jgi:hypothetical protein